MKTMNLIVLAAVLAVTPACKKKEEPKPTGSGQTMGSAMGSGAMGSGAMGSTETADFIDVLAEHKKKKEGDPVVIHFTKFKVTKAAFDPAKVEGGTATIEVDLTSLTSGSGQRDEHLKSADYLNTGKLGTMTIAIDNVKTKAGKTYTADANVKLAGIDRKYPVEFEVVDAKEDWIRVKGERKFPRGDFKIGKDVGDKDESVGPDITIKVGLTLKKT